MLISSNTFGKIANCILLLHWEEMTASGPLGGPTNRKPEGSNRSPSLLQSTPVPLGRPILGIDLKMRFCQLHFYCFDKAPWLKAT